MYLISFCCNYPICLSVDGGTISLSSKILLQIIRPESSDNYDMQKICNYRAPDPNILIPGVSSRAGMLRSIGARKQFDAQRKKYAAVEADQQEKADLEAIEAKLKRRPKN